MFEIIYVVGLILLSPVFIGTTANMLKYRASDPAEGVDYALGFLITLCTIWFWPVLVPGFYAVTFARSRNPSMSFLKYVFPAAPTPMTAYEREAKRRDKEKAELNAAKAKILAQRNEIYEFRTNTNKLEAENGLPLTKWEKS